MSRRGLLLTTALLVAAGVALALVLGSRGDDGGGAPEAAPVRRALYADAAVSGDGRLAAAWTEERGGRIAVMSAERPAGGPWSDAQVVQAPQRWRVGDLGLAVGDRGDAVVTFTYRSRQDTVLLAAYRPAGGAWERPQVLAPVVRGFYAGTPALAGDGSSTVAWSSPFVGPGGVGAAERAAGGGWHGPVRLEGTARGGSGSPLLAVAPDGRATLVVAAMSWGRDDAPAMRVFTRTSSGAWTPAAAPPGPGPTGAEAALAADSDGGATLAWVSLDDGRSTLWSSRFAEGAWSAPRVLDRGPADAWFGSVAAGRADDGVAIAWTRWVTRWRRVAVRMLPPGATAPRTLDTFDIPDIRGDAGVRTMPGPPPTRVVLAHAGPHVAMWDRLVTREPVFAARLMASRDGGAPEEVSAGQVSGWPLAVGSAGDRVVSSWADYVSPATGGVRILASERRG